MNFNEFKLNHLFEGQDLPDLYNAGFHNSEKIVKLKSEVLKKIPGINWAKLLDEAVNLRSALMNINLKDILESALEKTSEIIDAIEKGKEHPDDISMVNILERTLVSTHHPKVELLIEGINIGSIDFELIAKLKMKGIILTLKNGRIIDLTAASCKALASLSIEGVMIFDESSKEFYF